MAETSTKYSGHSTILKNHIDPKAKSFLVLLGIHIQESCGEHTVILPDWNLKNGASPILPSSIANNS